MPKNPNGKQILLGLGLSIALCLVLNQAGESESRSESETFKNVMEGIALPFDEVGHYETISISFAKGNLLQVNSDFRMEHIQILIVENRKRFLPKVKTQLIKVEESVAKSLGRPIDWTIKEVLTTDDGRAVIRIEATCPAQPLTLEEFWQSI